MAAARMAREALEGKREWFAAFLWVFGCVLAANDVLALEIAGTVGSAKERAVAGAIVKVWPEDAHDVWEPDGDSPLVATTDEQGRFAVAGLSAGSYRVAIEASGYAPHDMAVLPAASPGERPLRIELAPAVFLVGVVADAKDAPVPEAELRAERQGGRLLDARTDRKGRFRLGPLAGGDAVTIDVYAEGVGTVYGWEATAPRDDLRIRIRGSGTLHGRVVDGETGDAVASYRMELAGLDSGKRVSRDFQSAEGVFTWEALRPGRFAATVSAEGYDLHVAADIEMSRDGADRELAIALRPEAVVRGLVLDIGSGLPIAGASIHAEEGDRTAHGDMVPREANAGFGFPTASTDAQGRFVLRQLPRQLVTLRIRAKGYLSATALAEPDGYLTIELSDGASIRGHLLDGAGVPTDGIVMLADPVRFDPERRVAATAADGFAFERLAPGRYRLTGRLAAADRAWPFSTAPEAVDVVLGADEDAVGLRVGVARIVGCTLSGSVRGLLAGEDAEVRLTHFNGSRQRRHGVEVRAGRYAQRVRAGEVRARASTSTGRALEREVVACTDDEAAPEGATLDFAFAGRARLFGTVTRSGEPVQATVRVVGRFATGRASECEMAAPPGDCATLYASAVTSPSGQYAIRGLTDGAYALEVEGSRHRQTVSVVGDTRLDVDLEQRQEITFAGVVTNAHTGEPLPRARVSLMENTAAAQREFAVKALHTGAGGAFSMRLTPGVYRVLAHKGGFAAVWYDQTLAESTTDARIELAPATAALVRVTDARTGQPLAFVALRVASEGVALRLDQDGSARLWEDLVGRDLAFLHPSYEAAKVPAWDGRPLELRMVAADAAKAR